jgi:hypothetical protein
LIGAIAAGASERTLRRRPAGIRAIDDAGLDDVWDTATGEEIFAALYVPCARQGIDAEAVMGSIDCGADPPPRPDVSDEQFHTYRATQATWSCSSPSTTCDTPFASLRAGEIPLVGVVAWMGLSRSPAATRLRAPRRARTRMSRPVEDAPLCAG